MMKRVILLLVLLAGFSLSARADDTVIDITASGNHQPALAIPPAQPLEGAGRPEVAKTVAEILSFDMKMTGIFNVMEGEVERGKGIRPGEFDFSLWRTAGASLLVKTGYLAPGPDRLTLEFRLYDVATERMITARRLTGPPGELRRIVHTFADEILRALTGEGGPFTGKIAFVSKRSGNKEIYLMDWDGSNVQKITANGSINLNPEFFPSGKQLIYTSYKKRNPDLYRREIASGAEARISARPGINVTGAVAPSGDRIALAMSKDGNSEIYLIDTSGKELARLTRDPGIDVSPAWSPDGKKIAFVSDRYGKPQVFVMDANGSGVHRLTTSGPYNVGPRWSPKGDLIAYAAREGGSFQIHVIRPDGGGDTRLTSEGNNEHPRWSPDGRFIVFSSTRGGKEGIYVMRSDGSGQTRISKPPAGDSHPVWSVGW